MKKRLENLEFSSKESALMVAHAIRHEYNLLEAIESAKRNRIVGAKPTVKDHWAKQSPPKRDAMMYNGLKIMEPGCRLSQQEAFTSNYMNRIKNTHQAGHSGDYVDDPINATRMLKSLACRELTIPGRAQDFSSTVEWRLQLRS